jgi:predicted nucleotidyltransferase
LGVAYIRAIKRLNSHLKALTVRRVGAGYNCAEITAEKYQSATALREKIFSGEGVAEYVPSAMNEIIERERSCGTLTETSELDSAVLAFFRLADADDLDGACDAGGGIANRIIDAAKESTSYEEMFQKIRTKRYTDAKLRRAILFCMTGTKETDVCSLPRYTTLLAINSKGRELISSGKKTRKITVVTKPADAPDSHQKTLSLRLDGLYGLARKNKFSYDTFIKKTVYVEK